MKCYVNTMPIDDAAIILHGAIPTSDAGWRTRIFSPDYIIDRARTLGAEVDVVFVRDWEAREDDDLVELLFGDPSFSAHDVIVVTDLCLGASPAGVPKVTGAFVVGGQHLGAFVEQYRATITEHFVDGDVIVLSRHDRMIRVFHHEGAVFRIQLAAQ